MERINGVALHQTGEPFNRVARTVVLSAGTPAVAVAHTDVSTLVAQAAASVGAAALKGIVSKEGGADLGQVFAAGEKHPQAVAKRSGVYRQASVQ